jgi:hypothetical protein
MIRLPYKFRGWWAEKILDWADKRPKPQYPKTVVSAAEIKTLRGQRGKWRVRRGMIKRLRRMVRRLPPVRGYEKFVQGYRQTITSLQITRKYQKRGSDRDYDMSRPPSRTSVEYLFFRLIELCTTSKTSRALGKG